MAQNPGGYNYQGNVHSEAAGYQSYFDQPNLNYQGSSEAPTTSENIYTDLQSAQPNNYNHGSPVHFNSSYIPAERNGFENRVLQELRNVTDSIQGLTQAVNILVKKGEDAENEKNKAIVAKKNKKKMKINVCKPPPGFPLKTMEQFEKFEKDKTSMHRALKAHLIFQGGRNLKEALQLYIQVVMTPKLAENFTWTGKTTGNVEGKISLCTTKLIDIFYEAVKENLTTGSFTSKEWKAACQSMLKNHKQIALNARNAEKKSSSGSRQRTREQELQRFPDVGEKPSTSAIQEDNSECENENISDSSQSSDQSDE